MVALHRSSVRVGHMVWCRPHSRHWWEAVKSGVFGSEWWKENLCMSQDTFDIICNELCPHLQKQVLILTGYLFIGLPYMLEVIFFLYR